MGVIFIEELFIYKKKVRILIYGGFMVVNGCIKCRKVVSFLVMFLIWNIVVEGSWIIIMIKKL